MKTLGGFALGFLVVSCGFAQRGGMAQNRGAFVNSAPLVRTTPRGVFPGTIATPGFPPSATAVLDKAGSASIYSGGFNSAFRAVPNFGFPSGRFGRRGGVGNGGVVAYPVPVYVGGYGMYDGSYAGYGYPDQPMQQQQPSVTVIMPPQQPPVIINQFGPGTVPAQMAPPTAQETAPAEPSPASSQQQTHYLIAFKDHTIYSAVAYWVDGDTLHYFTSGNTHNQVSIALIDRALTERLNRESGLEVRLPAPAK